MTTAPRPRHRCTPEEHAQAFAVVLSEEFGVRFTLHDALSGKPVTFPAPCDATEAAKPGLAATAVPRDGWSPEEVRRVVEAGQAYTKVVRPAVYELAVVLYQAGRPAFVAVGHFTGLAQTAGDTEREQTWLKHWLQSFGDRLRLSDQLRCENIAAEEQAAQARIAWEALLTLDSLMRRLRVHKDPTGNQYRVLETAHALLGAATLLCVPADAKQPVVMHGEPLLAAADCVHLAGLLAKGPGYTGSGPLFCNHADTEPWAAQFPNITTLLAMPICDLESPGWVIAINKAPRSAPIADSSAREIWPFRKSDAALLMPFVALLRMHHSASTRFQDLKQLMVGLARSLTAAIDAKDSYTFGHSERVARIGVELGRTMGLVGDALSDIYLAGLLHDVGKIGVPDAILQKPGALTDEEFAVVKQHVTIGHTILADLTPIRHLLPGVLYHHERYDGRGYPEGLAGESIPHLARILAVADAFDAMSTSRPYRTAIPFDEVEKQLREGAGKQWDAQVVDAFLRSRHKIHAIRQRGVGESLRQALDGAMRSTEPSTRVF